MKDKVIAVDVDGVIADCMTPMADAYERLHGEKPGLPTTWELTDSWNIDSDRDLWEDFMAHGGYQECSPYVDALASLSDLRYAGYGIILITARGTEADPVVRHNIALPKKCRQQTFGWLTQHKVTYDRLFHSHTKLSYNYDVIIDDNPDIIERVNSEGKTGWCFKRNWNKQEIAKRNIPSVKNWDEAVSLITKTIK